MKQPLTGGFKNKVGQCFLVYRMATLYRSTRLALARAGKLDAGEGGSVNTVAARASAGHNN